MGYSIRITEAFEDDLLSALSYLIEARGANGAAKRLMREVDEAKTLLVAQPFMHAFSKKPRLGDFGYREHFLSKHVIVYRVEGDEVLLLRLFHQAQLYERFVMEWGR